jgi:hypothetical protein
MENTYDLNDVLTNFSSSLNTHGGQPAKSKEYNPDNSELHQQSRVTDSLNNSMSTTLSQSLSASQNANNEKSLLAKLVESKQGEAKAKANNTNGNETIKTNESNGGNKQKPVNRLSQKSSRVVPVESYSSSDDEAGETTTNGQSSAGANNDDENNNDSKSYDFDDDDADDDDADDDQDFLRKKNDDNDSESFYDAVDQK